MTIKRVWDDILFVIVVSFLISFSDNIKEMKYREEK